MALTKAQLVDLNANELIVDLDADTSITADTDDQIDIKIVTLMISDYCKHIHCYQRVQSLLVH